MLRDASTWWPAEGWRSAGWPESVGVMMTAYCPSGTKEKAPRTIVGANLTFSAARTSICTTTRSRVATKQVKFPLQDHGDKPTGPHEQHVLRLIISDYRWVANCGTGTLWYEANDMDDKDIASFALLDTLTRWDAPPRWHLAQNPVTTRWCGTRCSRSVGNTTSKLCAKVVERSLTGMLEQ